MSKVLQQAVIQGLPRPHRGKVRDTFDLGSSELLMVATDRVSAFDSVLPTLIPDKGRVLNLMSAFWFEKTRVIVPNHLVTVVDSMSVLKEYVGPAAYAWPTYLIGRSMVVRRAKRLPVECVVRGYLAGSAWAEYQESGTINGQRMPSGLQESQQLPEMLFTPTTKAETGHDLPLTLEQLKKLVGIELAVEMASRSFTVYNWARNYAASRGIIIADSKFEFGLIDGKLALIDEVLTPDSSRFWDAEKYEPGRSQDSFDKQPLRDRLKQQGWAGKEDGPPPQLSEKTVFQTRERYVGAYRRLVGKPLPI